MRIRLQILIPLTMTVLVAGGFALTAANVAEGVREALLTVPGITRDRAVETAVATVVMAGIATTGLALVMAVWLARAIGKPLHQLAETADVLGDTADQPTVRTPVAEIQDAARAVSRAGEELAGRHGRDRRERAELAALVEAVSEGIMRVDAEGRVVRLNEASRSILGLPQSAEGRPVAALLRREELRRLVNPIGRSPGVEAAEVVLEDRRVLVTTSSQPDGGVVATFVDLTDLRRLEEVRRDFVANASHELKTPLTSIRGYADTLLTGDLAEPERRQFLQTISRNADRLQRIVDDLLDLSRLETGRWEPALEPVPLADLARAAWRPFADRAAARDVTFTLEPRDEPVAVADPRGVEQVLTNLYDNALRHTPPGGRIIVRLRTDAGEPAGEPAGHAKEEPPVARAGMAGWVVAEVADTGSGIPRDALPRIFERFYRVDPARSRAEGGTGLGLSIVKHLVESMGGQVSAESKLGKGTTVSFRLPRAA